MSPDVILINPPYPRRHGSGSIPPIGLCYLAASLEHAGVQVQIIDAASLFPDFRLSDSQALERSLQPILCQFMSSPPRVVGIGPFVTATLVSTAAITRAVRAAFDTTVVLGGALCAAPGVREAVFDYVGADAFVAGDGERPICSLYRSLAETGELDQTIPGLGTRHSPNPAPYREMDLDGLPPPRRELLTSSYHASDRREIAQDSTTAAFLSRGCPYSCSFCAAPLASGKTVRRLSPASITRDIARCAREGFNSIIFYDDCLFVRSPKLNERVMEFVGALAAVPWSGTFQLELRCDAVVGLSDDVLNALRSVGCRQINMGIEKGHAAHLKQIQKRLTPEIALEACTRLSDQGFRTAGTFILGGVNETEEDIQATIDFSLKLPLMFAHYNPLALYPGTALFQTAYPDKAESSWLGLCLDSAIAPMGDILWSSADLPLYKILDYAGLAYRSFYTQARLEEVLRALPQREHAAVRAGYENLRENRASSWSQANEADSQC